MCGEKHLCDLSAEPRVSLNLFSIFWGRRSPFCSQASEGSFPGTTWTQKKMISLEDQAQGLVSVVISRERLLWAGHSCSWGKTEMPCEQPELPAQAALRHWFPSWFWCWCKRQPSLSFPVTTLQRGLPTTGRREDHSQVPGGPQTTRLLQVPVASQREAWKDLHVEGDEKWMIPL